MLRGAIKLFTVRGIEIRLDYSWFIIFGLVTYTLAEVYYPPEWPLYIRASLGFNTAILFFVSVLLHELSHSFVAQAHGIEVPRITLFIFGGAAQIAEEPRSARDEFLIAAAGPAMSVAIAIVCGGLALAFSGLGIEPIKQVFGWLSLINVTLAVFNLIPGFPLDGGRVLRALVWGASKDAGKSTRVAAAVGQGVAILFIGGGAALAVSGKIFNGIWIAFIGWFLLRAARASAERQAMAELLEGHTAGEVMSQTCNFIGPEMTLQALFYNHILRLGQSCFPVMKDGRVLGMLTQGHVREVPTDRWATTTAEMVMTPAEKIQHVDPSTPLNRVLDLMTRYGAQHVPVVDNGHFRGIVSRGALNELLRAKSGGRVR